MVQSLINEIFDLIRLYRDIESIDTTDVIYLDGLSAYLSSLEINLGGKKSVSDEEDQALMVASCELKSIREKIESIVLPAVPPITLSQKEIDMFQALQPLGPSFIERLRLETASFRVADKIVSKILESVH